MTARFWTAPVLWRFSIWSVGAKAAVDCRSPRRYRGGAPTSAVHTVLNLVIEYLSRANFIQRRHGKALKALQTAQAARPLGVRIFRYGSMQRSRSWLHWQSK